VVVPSQVICRSLCEGRRFNPLPVFDVDNFPIEPLARDVSEGKARGRASEAKERLGQGSGSLLGRANDNSCYLPILCLPSTIYPVLLLIN
jgi:hypothetical protein